MAQQRRPGGLRQAGPIAEVGFEIGASAVDQVVADVRRAIGR